MPRYIHGHDESVLRSHKWRTVENSIKFLTPFFASSSTLRILDVGCGPGTITLDIAKTYPHTKVTGLDKSELVLVDAKADAQAANITNLEYITGDIYKLPFDDNTFDVVLSHQTLQHIDNPVKGLSELARVVKPGGTVGVRDAIYETFAYGPRAETDWYERFKHIYKTVAIRNGGQPDAGAYYLQWAESAGLDMDNVKYTTSNWTYSSPADLEWLGGSWSDRVLKSDFANLAIEIGVNREELEEISNGWRQLSKTPNAVFIMVHGELLYTK